MAYVEKVIRVKIESAVGNALKGLDKYVEGAKAAAEGTKGIGAASSAATVAVGSFVGMLSVEAVKAFGQAVGEMVKQMIDLGAQTQKTVAGIAAMKNYVGSATEAYRAFNDVGRNTNYDLQAVQQMGAQLLNMGYNAKGAADLIQLCADTAAGLNKGQDGAQQLVDTLSRIHATGEMSSRQLISLQMAGMDLDKAFASVGMSAEQAMKAMDDGTLDAQTAIKALTDYMHEFDGAMAESKNNITDQWGDVKGNLETIFGEIGESIFDAFNQSGIVQELIDFTQSLIDMIRSDGTGAFTDLKDIASEVLYFIGGLLGFVLDTIKLIIVILHDAYAAFRSFGAQVVDAIRPAVDAVIALYNAVKAVMSSIGKNFGSEVGKSWGLMLDSGLEPEERAERRKASQKNNFRQINKSAGGGARSGGGGGGGAAKALSEEEKAVEALIKKYSDADKMLKNVIKSEIEVAKIDISMMQDARKATEETTVKLRALKLSHDEVIDGYLKELDIAEKISDSATRDNVINGINKQIEAENNLYQARLRLADFEDDVNHRKENTEVFEREMQHIQNLLNMNQIFTNQRIEMENKVLQARKEQLEETLSMLKPYSEEWINTEQQLADTIQRIHANAAYNVRSGWQEALRDLANQQISFKDTFVNAFGSIENSLVSLVSGTESAKDKFKRFCEDVTKPILEAMTQIIIKGLITNAIMSAIGMGGGSVLKHSSSGATYQMIGNTYVGNLPRRLANVASGGYIQGAGTSTSDSIPAMLSNGEYVVRAAAVKRIGVPRLNAINSGIPHFANGGYVGKTSGNGAPPVVINLHNESGVALDAQQTDAKFDGEKWVIGIVMNGIANNTMGMRSMLKGGMA